MNKKRRQITNVLVVVFVLFNIFLYSHMAKILKI